MPSAPTVILPGLFHWTATRPRIHSETSSYWLDGGVAIDPLLDEHVTLDRFAARPNPPSAVLLSNRHHLRSAGALHEQFGCEVSCNAEGMHEFAEGPRLTPFRPRDGLPGPALAYAVDAICPNDTGLYPPGQRALLFADAIVSRGEGHGFVPDRLIDDPAATRRRILHACERLPADEELDFDTVLLAHGAPVAGDGCAQLQELVALGGRTTFEF